MVEVTKARATVRWWDDADTEWCPEPESVQVSIGYEDNTLTIDGLRDGYYLSIPLQDIAEAIALAPR